MLTFDLWSERHIAQLTATDKANDKNFLVRTKESILDDLQIVFGSKEKAEQELTNILKQEYELYTQRVKLGIEE